MSQPATYAELQEQMFQHSQDGGPAGTAAYCREVLDAGTVPEDTTRAMLLVHLGEYSEMAGDSEAAGRAFTEAVEDGGQTRPDARCYLANWFADHGDQTQADRVIGEIWAERPTDPDVYIFLGEHLETHGDPAGAIKWYTTGVMRTMRNPSAGPSSMPILLVARRRARLASGFREDEFDRRARQAIEAQQQHQPQRS